MPTLKLLLLTFALSISSNSSNAHPHIWVYTDVELLVAQNEITGIKVHWNFDEIYSASFLEYADINRNMKLEEDEVQYILKSVFRDNLEALYTFMHIQMHGKKNKFHLKSPKIWMAKDETLHYVFALILEEPVSIKGNHEIAFYDPEFYVSFEQSYEMKIPEQAKCLYELEENKDISIYEGLMHPETYKLQCKEV